MSTGEAAQVTCSVSSGDLPLEISWSFEGRSVSDIPGITTMKAGKKASVILIDPISAEHRGNYTCTAKNRAGVSNYTSALHINGNSTEIFIVANFSFFYFSFLPTFIGNLFLH